MEAPLATLTGGAVLGLASALHCASMCGAISAGMLSFFAPDDPGRRVKVLLSLQAGRIITYIVLGAAVGLAGSAAFSLMVEPALASRILQWAAAVSLMWIGLSIAGLMPALPAVGSPLTGLTLAAGNLFGPARRHPVLGPLSAGLSWGICPCPMVYGALFAAALTGSLAGGATLMAGFGAGTLPAVVASALGLSSLARLRTRPWAHLALGLSIAALGFSTVYFKWPVSAPLCLTP
jgi:sulfite exporter TauE/SafE